MVASLAFNLDRDDVIDYSIPVFPRYTLTLWKPLGNRAPSLDLTAYIDIFHTNVWIFIATTYLVTAATFYIMDKSGNNHFHKVNNSEEFCFLNSVALSAILLIKLSYEVMVKSIPARIIYLRVEFCPPRRTHAFSDVGASQGVKFRSPLGMF